MMAMTPSGMRMRPTSRPLGRCHWVSTAPTGSGRPATWRQAAAISAMMRGVRRRRSMRGASMPAASAAARSRALAASMSASRDSSSPARRSRASILAAGDAAASLRAAALARLPMDSTSRAMSPVSASCAVPLAGLVFCVLMAAPALWRSAWRRNDVKVAKDCYSRSPPATQQAGHGPPGRRAGREPGGKGEERRSGIGAAHRAMRLA